MRLYARRPLRLHLIAVFILVAPIAAVAQDGPPASPAVLDLADALAADQRAHLVRVGAWGAANAAAGLALIALSDAEADRARRAFGIQTAAWGVINGTIAAVGLARGPGEATAEWASALGAENAYADILLVNLGLNVGYSAVGATMALAASRGVPNAELWRGHGLAVVIQGVGLLVLDTVAYLGTRARLDALTDLVTEVALHPVPGGVGLVLQF